MVGPAPENFDGEHRFLQLLVATLQMPLDHESEEPGQALIAGEAWTCEHCFQLPPDSIRV